MNLFGEFNNKNNRIAPVTFGRNVGRRTV